MSIQLAAVSHLFASLVIVLLSVALWYIIRRVYRSAVDTAVDKGARATMVRVSMDVFRFLFMAGTILLILQVNGVNVSSVFAGLGILSAVVGLALQDMLKDMIMGFHIVSEPKS